MARNKNKDDFRKLWKAIFNREGLDSEGTDLWMDRIINENMQLTKARHFRIVTHKVDYETLLLESRLCKPGREVYHKSGICSVIVEFDGRSLDFFYSEKTVWSNRLLQSWLRKIVKAKIMEVAERVLPERLHYWEAQKGVKAYSVEVKVPYGCVLGRCDGGDIELNPILILMPEAYMDYVILHEMAHLRIHNHSDAFWNYLSELIGKDAFCQHLEWNGALTLGGALYVNLGRLLR